MEKIKETFRKGYPKRWVEDRLLEDAAKAAGVEVSEELAEQYRGNAFRNFKAKGDKGYEVLLSLPGFTRELWEDQVLSEARRHAMREFWAKAEPADIPADYADKVLANIAKWNEAMAMTNAFQFAKATNVWQKLKAGADFVKTARVNTENADEIEDNCEWGSLDDKFLADEPELLKALKAMKPGDFSPPVEADGGILIARLNLVEDDGSYNISRIFFRKGNTLAPASKGDIIAAAEKRHVEDLFKKKLGELVEKSGAKFADIGQ